MHVCIYMFENLTNTLNICYTSGKPVLRTEISGSEKSWHAKCQFLLEWGLAYSCSSGADLHLDCVFHPWTTTVCLFPLILPREKDTWDLKFKCMSALNYKYACLLDVRLSLDYDCMLTPLRDRDPTYDKPSNFLILKCLDCISTLK